MTEPIKLVEAYDMDGTLYPTRIAAISAYYREQIRMLVWTYSATAGGMQISEGDILENADELVPLLQNYQKAIKPTSR